MILPIMFHWSPTGRRNEILKSGLIPNQTNVIASAPMSHICLSTTPSMAWTLSGGTGWTDVDKWDLWQVRLGKDDEVHIRPEFGNFIKEVTVRNVISPDRIWYVGSRII